MRFVKHTAVHIFVHLALFTALAMLIPIVSVWLAQDTSAISTTNETINETTLLEEDELVSQGLSSGQKNTLAASIMLIIVSVIFVYRIKESLAGMLKSIGAMVFLPGALTVIFTVFSPDRFMNFIANTNWLSLLLPIIDFYIHHSVPGVISVAAVYMMIGGFMYWIGNIMISSKHNLQFHHKH